MVSMLSQIKSTIYHIYRKIRWRMAYLLAKKVSIDNNSTDINGKRIMVIAPHADDELIGCYSIIKRYSPQIVCCSLTGNNKDEKNKRIRETEFISLCNALCEHGRVLDEKLEDNIHESILQFKPELILIPSYVDWHSEHRMINETLYRFIKETKYECDVGWYQVSVPISACAVNHIEILTKKDANEKWDLFFKVYKSQTTINVKRIRLHENYQCKAGITEVYCLLKRSEFVSAIENAQSITKQMNALKLKLNDIGEIKKKTDEYYASILSNLPKK